MSIEVDKKLGFGTMRLPLTDPDNSSSIDFDRVNAMVDAFMEKGFRYFDTAYPYHGEHSEEAVRKCLTSRYPRESYLLADKMPILRVKGPEDYERYAMNRGKASECLKCGLCEKNCPQHIPIRDFLAEFAALYEG